MWGMMLYEAVLGLLAILAFGSADRAARPAGTVAAPLTAVCKLRDGRSALLVKRGDERYELVVHSSAEVNRVFEFEGPKAAAKVDGAATVGELVEAARLYEWLRNRPLVPVAREQFIQTLSGEGAVACPD